MDRIDLEGSEFHSRMLILLISRQYDEKMPVHHRRVDMPRRFMTTPEKAFAKSPSQYSGLALCPPQDGVTTIRSKSPSQILHRFEMTCLFGFAFSDWPFSTANPNRGELVKREAAVPFPSRVGMTPPRLASLLVQQTEFVTV